MMKNIFTQSNNFNANYASQIIRVDNIHKHPTADKLDIVVHQGFNIIVGKGSVNVGDIMVYCAVESALNKEFLSKNNQFEDKELNVNTEVKGYFNRKCRCRTIKLVGEISRGFLFPPSWLQVWQPDLKIDDIEEYVGVEFDTINSILFSKKYIVEQPEIKSNVGNKTNNKRNKKLNQFDRLIQNQFNFHYDTAFLSKNLHKIEPDDVISITAKFHGTSLICSYSEINKQLKWYERILKRFGVNIIDKEYGDIVSSRGVIKNRYINKEVGYGYYKVAVWTEAAKGILPHLSKNMTIYGEIVGYLPGTKSFIQKNHDYKCSEGEFMVYIYRITYTNPDGVVYEFSAKQVQNWCKEKGLLPVKELYYGKAKDLYPELNVEQHWKQNFLSKLQNDKVNFYMEMNSPDCNNKVPHEGIVIRNDSKEYHALKLKCEKHYLMETEDLDSGYVDIETSENND